MKLRINITKEILKESAYCSTSSSQLIGQNCAIGRAIVKLFGNRSLVEGTSISIFDKHEDVFKYAWRASKDYWSPHIKIPLPFKAVSFIQAFDNSNPEQRLTMPEFSFEIEVSNEVIDMIGIGEVYKVLSESSSMELVMN